jgi:xanthine dehydrogenase YagT iron-sulfur-binding subunit
VNGAPTTVAIEARATLLDVLRDHLHLTGTKRGCDHGQCGSCTILVDGRRVLACLALAALHEGADVTTIEGLAIGGELHPVQQAFLEHDALQCGACTPGQIMSAFALLREPVGDDDRSLQEAMSGNLCRCGAYANILAAVRQGRQQAARRHEDQQLQQQQHQQQLPRGEGP